MIQKVQSIALMNEKGGREVEEKNSLPPSETIINKGSLRDLVEVEVKKKKNILLSKDFRFIQETIYLLAQRLMEKDLLRGRTAARNTNSSV